MLKTLTPERGADPVERNHLLHESWLAKRAVARFFAQVIDIPPERKSALYYLQTWHAGATLGQWLTAGRHVSIPEALRIGIALVRAIGALHRRSILHRDIKPENVHIGNDNEIRLLDFGVAISGLSPPSSVSLQAGTPRRPAASTSAVCESESKGCKRCSPVPGALLITSSRTCLELF